MTKDEGETIRYVQYWNRQTMHDLFESQQKSEEILPSLSDDQAQPMPTEVSDAKSNGESTGVDVDGWTSVQSKYSEEFVRTGWLLSPQMFSFINSW